jgi:hypothetical protein
MSHSHFLQQQPFNFSILTLYSLKLDCVSLWRYKVGSVTKLKWKSFSNIRNWYNRYFNPCMCKIVISRNQLFFKLHKVYNLLMCKQYRGLPHWHNINNIIFTFARNNFHDSTLIYFIDYYYFCVSPHILGEGNMMLNRKVSKFWFAIVLSEIELKFF